MSIRESILSTQEFDLSNQKNLSLLQEDQFKPSLQSYELLKSSLPNIISMLGNFTIAFFTVGSVNYLYDNNFVAGYGLGKTIINSSMYSIIVSLNIGLGTQLSHAYGAKNYQLVGILLQRSWFVCFSCMMLLLPLFLNLKNILMYYGVNEEISQVTHDFCLCSYPIGFCTIINDSLRKYIMAQKEFKIIMISSNIAYGLSPVYLYIFLFILDLKVIGIALVFALGESIGALILYFYITQDIKKNQEKSIYFRTWIPFNKQALEIKTGLIYLKKSLIIGSSTFLEWIFMEIMTFYVVGLDDEYALAAHVSFAGAFVFFFFLTPLAISFTVNTFLGNKVGENQPKIAKNIVKISLISTLIFVTIFYIIGQLLKPIFFENFTTGPKMREQFELIYNTYLNTFFFPDSFQIVIQAILRSLGLENFASLSFSIIYYVVGLPLTYYLVFSLELGVQGIWFSEFIVASLVVGLFLYKLSQVNFVQICQTISQNQVNIQLNQKIKDDEDNINNKQLSDSLIEMQNFP